MNTINRLLATLLIIMFAGSICAYASPIQLPEDIISNDNKQAIEFVMTLGIMSADENYEFTPDKLVTRAEFASTIAKMLGLGDLTMSDGNDNDTSSQTVLNDEWMGSGLGAIIKEASKPIYSDVPFDFPYYTAINVVTQLKLMGGFDNGKFLPDETISYEQAISVMVRLLGFDAYAIQKGGYPVGYMMIANERKITIGNAVKSSDLITRGSLAALAARCLEADILEQDNLGSNVKYTIAKGKNILSERLEIKKAHGIVTAVEKTGLYDAVSGVRSDYVKIGNEFFRHNSFVTEEMLGKLITYYYSTQDEDDYRLVYVCSDKNHNAEVKFDTVDYTSFSDNYIKYYDTLTEKEEKAEVARQTPVIYNGVYYDIAGNMDFNALLDYSSDIRLLDNNGDSLYDAVFVNCYKSYIVRKIDAAYKKVFVSDVCSDGNVMSNSLGTEYAPLDFGDSKGNFRFWRDGVVADITSIKDGLILSVAQSINPTGKVWYDVHISTQRISGTLNETTSDEIIKIDDKEYRLVPNVKIPLVAGMSGTFYLDVKGKIAAYSQGDAVYDYAVIIDGAYTRDLSKQLELKMLTKQAGKIEYLKTDKKVLLNNEASVTPQKVAELLSTLSQTMVGSFIPLQIIAYKKNSEGLIKEIVTPTFYRTLNDTLDSSSVDRIIERKPVGILSTYTNAGGTKGPGVPGIREASRTNFNDFLLAKSGTIFDLSSPSEDDWCIKTGMNQIKNGRKYNCAAYNITFGNIADLMIIMPPENLGQGMIGDLEKIDDRGVVITKIISTLDKDGNKISKLWGLKEGKEVIYTIDAQRGAAKISKMDVGDFWHFDIDDKQRVIRCTQVFDSANINPANLYRRKLTTDDSYDGAFGKVMEVGEDALIIGVYENNTDYDKSLVYTARVNQWGAGSTNVVWYDSDRKTIEAKTSANITPNDLIFVSSSWNTVLQIIVIKNLK